MNIVPMNSGPISTRSTAPMSVRSSWFSRSSLPRAVAVRPRRMKTVENEAMNKRLGVRTLRQSASASSWLKPVIADR